MIKKTLDKRIEVRGRRPAREVFCRVQGGDQ